MGSVPGLTTSLDPKDDPDYKWLKSHLDLLSARLDERTQLASAIAAMLQQRAASGDLPYSMGVFGGWGTGKTTFLALLASELEANPAYRIIYFNSWKYAGFTEIVPALIYKILLYGVTGSQERRNQAAMRVLLSLGNEYSAQFGEWTERHIGINVTKLVRDAYRVKKIVADNSTYVDPSVVQEYYTQVDQAQSHLEEALGVAEPGRAVKNPIVVLIDELDRCDPDEAFTLLKQMRVLFAMRRMPIMFVVCANPDPIARAIKHRYGLASDDYESARILEKFVDSYEDLTVPPADLAEIVRSLWKTMPADVVPWIPQFDEATRRYWMKPHKAAYESFTTASPMYSNLRLLHKSLRYVVNRWEAESDLLWTIWHLEIVAQLYPDFRAHIRSLSKPLQRIIGRTYESVSKIRYNLKESNGKQELGYATDKGGTVYSIFRSYFWEHAEAERQHLQGQTDAESRQNGQLLTDLLANYRRIEFLVSMAMLPFDVPTVLTREGQGTLPNLLAEFDKTSAHLGWLFANY